MDRELLARLLAQGTSLEEIGRLLDRHPSTVSYWLQKYGFQAAHRQKHLARGGISHDALAAKIDEGLSIAQLAGHFEVSKTTVRHWLRQHDLQTRRSQRYRDGREASKSSGDVVLLRCPRHGLTEFGRRQPSGLRCLRCRSDAVTRRRRRVKEILVAEAGGRCAVCGYDRCSGALQFHHVSPVEKRFAISYAGVTRSLERARAEAAKCVLLCSNCHAEVESGALALPP